MFTRIKYVSRFARSLQVSEIEAIVARAQRCNAAIGVSGVLLAFGGVFMQIVEGPTDALDDLLTRIQRDDRHCDMIVLRRERAAGPLFGAWSMRLLELGAAAQRGAQPVVELIDALAHGRAGDEALAALDELVWRTLNEGAATLRRTG